MNLQAVASPYTAAVSPPTIGTLYVSAGATVNADYSQTPVFTMHSGMSFDVQALSGREIAHMAAMNIQGVMRSVYIQGNIEGVDRNAGKGGDVLYFAGAYWLVAAVSEPWANNGWTRVVVVQQNGKPAGIP